MGSLTAEQKNRPSKKGTCGVLYLEGSPSPQGSDVLQLGAVWAQTVRLRRASCLLSCPCQLFCSTVCENRTPTGASSQAWGNRAATSVLGQLGPTWPCRLSHVAVVVADVAGEAVGAGAKVQTQLEGPTGESGAETTMMRRS